MLTEDERRVLRPLLEGSRTLSDNGARWLRDLATRGYVRLSPALCMGTPTGETMAALTEAGRLVLDRLTEEVPALPEPFSLAPCQVCGGSEIAEAHMPINCGGHTYRPLPERPTP